jgi:hypothetical protein
MKLAFANGWSALALAALAFGLAGCSQPASTASHPEPDSTYQADPNAANAPPVTWDDRRAAFVQSGKPLAAGKLWRFAGSTDGFTVPGALATPAPGGGLSIQNKIYGAFLRTPDNLGLDGRRFSTILVRITRDAAGAQWDPIVYYTTKSHAETEKFKAKLYRGHNPATGETTVLVYDMRTLAAGRADWVSSQIRQVRFQTDDQPGGAFTIHEIAITEPLPR